MLLLLLLYLSRTSPRKEFQISKIIPHPDWNIITLENDIALIQLAEAVDVATYPPVCLPDKGTDFTGQTGLAVGPASTVVRSALIAWSGWGAIEIPFDFDPQKPLPPLVLPNKLNEIEV